MAVKALSRPAGRFFVPVFIIIKVNFCAVTVLKDPYTLFTDPDNGLVTRVLNGLSPILTVDVSPSSSLTTTAISSPSALIAASVSSAATISVSSRLQPAYPDCDLFCLLLKLFKLLQLLLLLLCQGREEH